jgi:hypothetical protein
MSEATLVFWSTLAEPVDRQPATNNTQSITAETIVRILALILRLHFLIFIYDFLFSIYPGVFARRNFCCE